MASRVRDGDETIVDLHFQDCRRCLTLMKIAAASLRQLIRANYELGYLGSRMN